MSCIQSIYPQGWGIHFLNTAKSYVQTARRSIDSLCSSLSQTVKEIHNFILPKNPITGKREFHFIPNSLEVDLGNIYYGRICFENEGKLDNRNMQKRVQKIVDRISPYAQRPGYKFEYIGTVLNSKKLNAWSLPGGKLAFFKGLIQKIDHFDLSKYSNLTKDDVLAAVVGHEIAHSAIGHVRNRIEKTFLIQMALFVLQMIIHFLINKKKESESNPEINETCKYQHKLTNAIFTDLLGFARDLYMLMDSRHAEYEADEYGIKLMHQAGYKIEGSLALQELFMYLKEHDHEPTTCVGRTMKRILEWTSTHPSSKNRLEANRKTIEVILKKDNKPSSNPT